MLKLTSNKKGIRKVIKPTFRSFISAIVFIDYFEKTNKFLNYRNKKCDTLSKKSFKNLSKNLSKNMSKKSTIKSV